MLEYVLADEAASGRLRRRPGLAPETVARRTRHVRTGFDERLLTGCLDAPALPRLPETLPVDSVRCRHAARRAVDLEAAAGLAIAHVDCDAFYASVEKRDHPALADQPLIVGGGAARRRLDLLLYRAHLRRALGHADGARAGALPERGRAAA